MPRHLRVVGLRLCRTGSHDTHDTHPNLMHRLHGHLSVKVGVGQVVDEPGRVLDGENVMVGWRREEPNVGCGVSVLGLVLGDLV